MAKFKIIKKGKFYFGKIFDDSGKIIFTTGNYITAKGVRQKIGKILRTTIA